MSDYAFGRWGTFLELIACVSGGVVLVSVAAGVERRINALIADPRLVSSHMVDVDLIHSILMSLTLAVLLTVLVNLAITAFVLGELVMRSVRDEIATRKDSGATARRLLVEYVRDASLWALGGAGIGQAIGVGTAIAINGGSPLPAALTAASWWGIWPVAVLTVVVANFLPAYSTARMSPVEYWAARR